jgi:hypothetical protein
VYPAQFISDFANKDFASPKLFTFQGKNELPEFPHFNARRHLQRFGNDVPAIQHYSPARGGWVNISTAFLFTIKEGKPIVLRRDGVTQMSSFDKDWEHANRPVGPVDYHLDMTNVRRTYREDKARQQKARSYSADVKPLPARLSSPAATVATPPSSSSSDLEVIGDVVLTPTKTVIPSLKRTAMGLRDGGRLHKRARHRTPPAQRQLCFSSITDSNGPAHVPPRWSPPIDSPSPRFSSASSEAVRQSTPPLPSPSSSPPRFSTVFPYGQSSVRSSPTPSFTQSGSPRSSPSPRSCYSPSLEISSSHRRKSKPWHDGLYCVEFADGLEMMANSPLSQKDAFHDAFPNRSWVRRTFQDNKRQWLDLATPSERSEAVAAGKIHRGLWRRFSKQHPIIKCNSK